MRIALLTMEALASAEPVRRFVANHHDRIACVGLSDPYRPQQGGMFGQARRLLWQSGLRLLPYLLANFSLPRIAGVFQSGRGVPEKTPLTTLCERARVPVRIKAEMNDPAFHSWMRGCGADLILTFHCDQILSQATIGALPHGALNVHAGLLPEQRGPVPTIHAMLNDPPEFGVTVHRIVPRIDAGPILARRAISLAPGTSALAAATLLHAKAVPIVIEILDALTFGTSVERIMAPGVYRGFPTPTQLRQVARLGHRAASWRDMLHALRTPI